MIPMNAKTVEGPCDRPDCLLRKGGDWCNICILDEPGQLTAMEQWKREAMLQGGAQQMKESAKIVVEEFRMGEVRRVPKIVQIACHSIQGPNGLGYVLYALTDDGRIFSSENGREPWNKVLGGGPWMFPE